MVAPSLGGVNRPLAKAVRLRKHFASEQQGRGMNYPAKLAVLAMALLTAPPAAAMDAFEIQVYQDDVGDPGQFGLELHSNYTVSGRKAADWPGESPPHRGLRFTLEPAVGVTDFFEIGAYLQLLHSLDRGFDFAGAKLRGKFVAPKRWDLPVMLGINVELGRVPRFVEQDGWANEFRPIVGWRGGRWLLVANPIFGWALTGPNAFVPDFEPCGKVAFDTRKGFEVGLEYYAGLGELTRGTVPLSQQAHMLYATFDLAAAPGLSSDWELNLAVGHGLTGGSDASWQVKSIVGRGF